MSELLKNKNMNFNIGPSRLYPTVAQHINNALKDEILSVSHRGGTFKEIYKNTVDNLRKLLSIPNGHEIFFLGSATEAMGILIENCCLEKSFHFVNGAFSRKLFELALELKKQPQKNEVEWGQGFEFKENVVPEEIELVCLTHNETSTGVMLDLKDIYKLREKYPNKLFALDITSSIPYADVDYQLIDYAFFSVQKGFGLPAGLGVIVVSKKAIEKAKKIKDFGLNIGGFHNLLNLKKMGDEFQTVETPNMLNIYLLGKVCEDMLNYGIDGLRKETEEKSALVYEFFDLDKRLFVGDKKVRSPTTVVIKTDKNSSEIIEVLKKKNILISSGYGKLKNEQIRIPILPAIPMEDYKKLLGSF